MKNGGYRLSVSDPTPDRVTLPVKINKKNSDAPRKFPKTFRKVVNITMKTKEGLFHITFFLIRCFTFVTDYDTGWRLLPAFSKQKYKHIFVIFFFFNLVNSL